MSRTSGRGSRGTHCCGRRCRARAGARRLATDCEWGPAEHLLRQVEYDLRVLCWQNTKDGQRGRNRPQPLQTPSERAGNRRRADAALARRDEIAAAFGIE